MKFSFRHPYNCVDACIYTVGIVYRCYLVLAWTKCWCVYMHCWQLLRALYFMLSRLRSLRDDCTVNCPRVCTAWSGISHIKKGWSHEHDSNLYNEQYYRRNSASAMPSHLWYMLKADIWSVPLQSWSWCWTVCLTDCTGFNPLHLSFMFSYFSSLTSYIVSIPSIQSAYKGNSIDRFTRWSDVLRSAVNLNTRTSSSVLGAAMSWLSAKPYKIPLNTYKIWVLLTFLSGPTFHVSNTPGCLSMPSATQSIKSFVKHLCFTHFSSAILTVKTAIVNGFLQFNIRHY